jgi:histidinol phosphatase-like enzyme (inositol monophosphatase family)
MMNDSLLTAVAELARLVGNTALGHYAKRLDVETKGDGSPVTAADRAAETVARGWIEAWFPKDGILGEEFGATRPDARRRWIIDPIDGTRTFVRGVPLWGTLVAVAEGESVLAGAACFPAVDEMVAAATGLGCWWNDSRCYVSSVDDLSAAAVMVTDERFRDKRRTDAWHELVSRCEVARTWGDCYGYLLVATGRAEAMVDDIVSPWDAAALMPIITEAGGSFTDWKGAPTAFGGDVIATNGRLASPVRDILIGNSRQWVGAA